MKHISKITILSSIIFIISLCGIMSAYAIPYGETGAYSDVDRITRYDHLQEPQAELSSLSTQDMTYHINIVFDSQIPKGAERTYSPIEAGIISETEYLELQNKALEITAGCVTDYDKVLKIHDWVANNIYYNYDYLYYGKTDSGVAEPYDVYKTGTAVCSGYSRLTFVMLDSLGIKCIDVGGVAGSENIESNPDFINHEWNMVYIDGDWITVDTTWDSWNVYSDGQKQYAGYHRTYFDTSDYTFAYDHRCLEISWVSGLWENDLCYRISNLNLMLNSADIGIEYVDKMLNVSYIGWGAFKQCNKLKRVELPPTVKSIDSQAFYGCSSLEEISIPYGIKEIKSWTFGGCSSLKSIDIPYSVNKIEDTAFYNCSALESIVIPYNVDSIPDWTFAKCSKLKQVELPSTVKSLGQYAFAWCDSLEEILVPAKLASCHDDAFSGSRPKIIGFGGMAEEIASKNNFEYEELAKEVEYRNMIFDLSENRLKKSADSEYICIPRSVNGITINSVATGAFDGCVGAGRIAFSAYIKDIQAGAFGNCTAEMIFTDYATYARNYAYENDIPYSCFEALLVDVVQNGDSIEVEVENEKNTGSLIAVFSDKGTIEDISHQDISSDKKYTFDLKNNTDRVCIYMWQEQCLMPLCLPFYITVE